MPLMPTESSMNTEPSMLTEVQLQGTPEHRLEQEYQNNKDIAWRAVKRFRELMPQLESYARAAIGKPIKLKLVTSHTDSSTDGVTIYMSPPFDLGRDYKHNYALCDRLDFSGQQRCAACRVREEIIAKLYHEISHNVYGTFEHKYPDIAPVLTKYHIKRMRVSRSNQEMNVYNAAGKLSPHLVYILNALEDVRVDSEMFKVRPALRRVMNNMMQDTMQNGISMIDGSRYNWSQGPLNAQVVLWCYMVARKHGIRAGTFAPEVMALESDQKLLDMLSDITSLSSVVETFDRSVGLWLSLKDKGYFLEEGTDEPPPLPEPDKPDQEPDPATQESQTGDSEEKEGEKDDPEGLDESEQSDSGDAGDDEADSQGQENLEDDRPDDSAGSESGDSGEDDSDSGDSESSDESGAGSTDESGSDSDQNSNGSESGAESDSGSESAEAEGDGSDSGSVSDSDADGSTDSAESGRSDGSGSGDSDSGSDSEYDPYDQSEWDDDESDESDSGSGSGWDRESKEPRESESQLEQEAGGHESQYSSGSGLAASDRESSNDLRGGAGNPDNQSDADAARGDDPYSDSQDGSTGTHDPSTELAESQPEATEQGELTHKATLQELWQAYLDKYGTSEDISKSMDEVLGHVPHGDPADRSDDEPESNGYQTYEQSLQEPGEKKLLTAAIKQEGDFEEFSENIGGIYRLKRTDDSCWDDEFHMREFQKEGLVEEVTRRGMPVATMASASRSLRKVFAVNREAKFSQDLRRGRIDTSKLGKRAPMNDDRVFKHTDLPGKHDYEVGIAIDISGSTARDDRLAQTKLAAMAQCDLLARVGIPFFLVAHSGTRLGTNWNEEGSSLEDRTYNYSSIHSETCLVIAEIKNLHEAWNTAAKSRLMTLPSMGYNIDGHAFEYMRRRLQKSHAKTRLMMYYSDGQMPAHNFDEELLILQREIEVCQKLHIPIAAVGIHDNGPAEYGLPMVLFSQDSDIAAVVEHIAEQLASA